MTNNNSLSNSSESGNLPNGEWELSDLIQMVTAELDQAQDTLILRSHNRRLSMMVNQLNLDLHVDVRRDPMGQLMFRTAAPGTIGGTVLKLGFTPALDTQIRETRKSIDLLTEEYRPLETLADIQAPEIQQLRSVGIHSVNDLELATTSPALLTEVASKTELPEHRLRMWRQLPYIAQITPPNGTPGSVVVLDGGNLGNLQDTVEVYFQDKLAKIQKRTNTRLIVEMPKDITGNGWVAAKIGEQKTNLMPWRADVIDLYVKDILLESSGHFQVDTDVSFRAVLSNEGSLAAPNFLVDWELWQVGTQNRPLPDYSLQAKALILDDSDVQGNPTQLLQRVSYAHGSLELQQQSTDAATVFKYRFDQPGTYRIVFTADPNNQTSDPVLNNNRFVREFVINPKPIPTPIPLPPVPIFLPSPNQFSPKSGRAKDVVTLFGKGFNGGTVRFGNVAATIVGTPTSSQIVAQVPAGLLAGNVRITVQTSGGTIASTDLFTVLANTYTSSSSNSAIGGSLL